MKSEWEFRFRAEGPLLAKDYQFRGVLELERRPLEEAIAHKFDTAVRIIPNRKEHKPSVTTGKIFITVPGDPEKPETEHLVHAILTRIVEKMEFPDARVRADGGFVFGTIIPETPEEAANIGDQRHFVRLRLVEVDRNPPVFNPDQLTAYADPTYLALLTQFNAARRGTDDVVRFLGYFKVIERAYANRGGNLLKALQASDDLYKNACGVITQKHSAGGVLNRPDFNSLLVDLIRRRDQCAHLRGKTGYLPNDPRIGTEVAHYLHLVASLAQRAVEEHRNRR
jgi:hypothetical protein